MIQQERLRPRSAGIARLVARSSGRWALWIAGVVFCTGLLPAAEHDIRLGWIDRFHSGSFSQAQIAALKTRLVGYDALACPEQRIVLQRVPDEEIFADQRELRGACGSIVQIPEDFDVNLTGHVYRGVIMDPLRPERESRQAWMQRSRRWKQTDGSPVVAMPVLRPESLPSDVVVGIDEAGTWQIGCDFNANLSFEPAERFVLPADQMDAPVVASIAGTTVVLRAAEGRTDAAVEPTTLGLEVLCVDALPAKEHSSESGQGMIAQTVVRMGKSDDGASVQWVLLPTGGGAADVAAAMAAAERADCDAVLVNLDGLLHWPTDAARLLASLSRHSGLPVVTTRQTPISPNFHVEPDRSSVADLAEILSSQSDSQKTFARAVGELITDLPRFRQAIQLDEMTAAGVLPSVSLSSIEENATNDRFVTIAGTQSCIARIPRDAVDGRIEIGNRAARFEELDVRLYDELGMRVTGVEHSNGVRFDSMPLAQAMRARGGYVVAAPSLFYRGRTVMAAGDDVRITWTHAAAVPADAKSPVDSESKIAQEQLPPGVKVAPRYRVDRLPPMATDDVPDSVQQIAAGLTSRGPTVASWWYREPPRHGSIAYHHVFEDEFPGSTQWPHHRLQFWVVYENGRLLPGYRSVGDLGGSNPADAWILVQAAVTDDRNLAKPPRLLQTASLRGRAPSELDWQRVPIETGDRQPAADLSSLSTEKSFLLAELRAEDSHPSEGWVWATDPQQSSDPMPWLQYYDHDIIQAAIAELKARGKTAAEIVSASPRPSDDSKDLTAWRENLVAIDQVEVRKSNLDAVVETSRRVLELCRERLDGLPPPERPYYEDMLATIESPEQNFVGKADAFQFQSDPQWLQTYAGAVDAAYRLTRAIGYRELPELVAEQPIVDQAAQDEAYEAALFQLCGLVEIKDPRFVLTLRRYHHRRDEPIKAYRVLRRHAYEGPATAWYFKKERDAFEQSGVPALSRLGHARWFLREMAEPVRQASP
ncbi:hypothetical protein [Allorhodopirellula solitaria]|uniref:Uncharacterized protein n=1 Tax=Allorhodopirellula solitaria TaxID=2527987 RepID=A0A5C5XSK2_9BACT|nr:hypothetical protein [Allorhodopirellula solitaria]TWT65025.1 hypothetical protein CA85_33700 [Allorhodopirellula solitaria]